MTSALPPPHRRDPFAATANPSAYVPRTATESVLVRLESALREGATALSLSGSAGSGKTLLLHVLAHRLDGAFQALYVPYPKLDPAEFCQWALAALNEPEGPDPEGALRGRIRRDAAMRFPPLLWMIDDAGLLPPDTLRQLVRLQAGSDAFLRLLFVRCDGAGPSFAAAGLAVEQVELDGAMNALELARYVRARLDRAMADTPCRARVEAALAHLLERSQGNPARLHAAAAELLCAGTPSCDGSRDTEARLGATHCRRA